LADKNIIRIQDQEDQEYVAERLAHFDRLYTFRVNYHQQWEEVAALIWPECRNTFEKGSYNYPGMKFTQSQLDSTGMIALDRFTGIMQHLLTPADTYWHQLALVDPYLNKQPRVALWLEQVTRLLFAHRNAQTANFQGQAVGCYKNLGAFGTMAMFVDQLDDPILHRVGLRYRAIPIGELFIYTNHQGQVVGVYRYFRMTAYQCHKAFGAVPASMESALEKGDQYQFEFLHHVGLREDFRPGRGPRGMPFRSDYIAVDGGWLMKTGGYPVFPYAVGRYALAPREEYGRSPAMAVLPSLKTLNAMKGMFLRTGARIADPVLLIQDEGFIDNVDLMPGALNAGGVSPDGKPLIHVLPTGNLQITENMMQAEAEAIKQEFLTSLFDILVQDRVEMTATEVLARAQEKAALLSPMIGRQTEFLGPMIDRELQILDELKLLPPMPPELREVGYAQYQVEYTSPLNNYMRAGQASGFIRTTESMMPIAQAIGDPSIFDIFDFGRAFADIADIQAVPASYMSTDRERQQKAQQRMQQLQAQMQIQAQPGQAGMISAQAKMMKAEHDTGQDQQQQGAGPQGQGAPPANMPPPGAGQAPQQYGPPPGTQ
jgi:hypothetical protein